MVDNPTNESRPLSMSLNGLDPDSAEFIAACLAVSNRAAASGLNPSGQWSAPEQGGPAPRMPEPELAEQGLVRPQPDDAKHVKLRTELEAARAELASAQMELEAARTELEAARAATADLLADRQEALTALESASKQADRDLAELTAATKSVADREDTISALRLSLAERDRDIAALQHHVLQAEEARIADATAIINSLDKFRA